MSPDFLYYYRAYVNRVVDGDTLDVTIDLGLSVSVHTRLRLADVDTPEVYGVKKESDEYKAGKVASERTRELVEGKWVTIRTEKDGTGKYGRYIAHVFLDDGSGETLNELLLREGLAEAS